MSKNYTPKLTIFYCINGFDEKQALPFITEDNLDVNYIKMACSSMVKDIFLLRAFESGSDAVAVLVCPEDACRYIEGGIRSKKRVEWVKKILDEIGINNQRLNLYHTTISDTSAVEKIIKENLSVVSSLGPNPATRGDKI